MELTYFSVEVADVEETPLMLCMTCVLVCQYHIYNKYRLQRLF